MRKIFYSVFAIATLGLVTSCTEDKGTSFETADANKNEYVDPNDIRGYDRPGTAGESSNAATAQDQASATELVVGYYTEPDRPSPYTPDLSYNETVSMGGQTIEKVDTTKTTTPKVGFGGSRPAGPGKQQTTTRPAAGNTTTQSNTEQQGEAVKQGNIARPEKNKQTTKQQTAKPQKQQDLKTKN